jgi:hypothetical protein
MSDRELIIADNRSDMAVRIKGIAVTCHVYHQTHPERRSLWRGLQARKKLYGTAGMMQRDRHCSKRRPI